MHPVSSAPRSPGLAYITARLDQIEHSHYISLYQVGSGVNLIRLREELGLFGWREYVAMCRMWRKEQRRQQAQAKTAAS